MEPYTCELPFDFESTTDNYFCVKNENENDKFQCNTALGEFGNCILGKKQNNKKALLDIKNANVTLILMVLIK